MNKLVVFSGLPGTGKSTLSKMWAEETNAVWLSVDPIEGAMKLSGVENNYQLGVAAYEIVKVLADQHLTMKRSVVVDAVNPTEETRAIWRDLAKLHKIDLHFVECVTSDPELHRHRIEKRVRKIPGMKEISWDRVLDRKAEYQPWQMARIVIRTDQKLEESFADLQKNLS